jgi:hypothetical protein
MSELLPEYGPMPRRIFPKKWLTRLNGAPLP